MKVQRRSFSLFLRPMQHFAPGLRQIEKSMTMKQCYAFFWLALMPCCLFAQNWQPILPGNFYHYQPEGDSLVITLWVDSTAVESGDSVFYLNRRVAEARDTVGGLGPLYRLNQPFFLMKQLRRLGPGQYRCEDSATLQLDARAAPGVSQPFDTARGLTLTLEARYDSVVFGQLDSVLRFRLNDDQRLLWSQNHGLLRFPALAPDSAAWELIGIAGADSAGVQVPTFSDFFAWQVGDVMEYEVRADHLIPWLNTTKLTILEHWSEGDSVLHYRARRVQRGESQFIDPDLNFSYQGVDTVAISIIDSTDHPVNVFSYQLMNYEGDPLYGGFPEDTLYSFITTLRHRNGTWTKQLGVGTSSNRIIFFEKNADLLSSNYTGGIYGTEDYRTGLGLTGVRYGDIGGVWADSSLVAYRTASDTMGNLSSDSALLVSVRLPGDQVVSLKAYPNPFSQTLTLQWDAQALGSEQTFLLQNAQGQTLLRQRLSGPDASWQLPELPSGIYYLRIEGYAGGVALRRL